MYNKDINNKLCDLHQEEAIRLNEINAELLEALGLAQSAILKSKAFNIRKDFGLINHIAQAIKKAKDEQ